MPHENRLEPETRADTSRGRHASWRKDIRTGACEWSEEFYRLCGLAPGSVAPSSERLLNMVHPADRSQLAAILSRASQNGEGFDIELRVVQPDGTVRRVRTTGDVLLDRDRAPESLIGSMYDIAGADIPRHIESDQLEVLRAQNDRLRAEFDGLMRTNAEAMERSRFVQLIADRLPAMMAYWDSNERCRFANGAYKDWFGITPEALRGKTMRDLLGDKLYRKNEPYIRGALRAGNIQEFERTITTPSGQIRHSQALYIPDIQDGVIKGMAVLVTDVTKLKQTEQALEEANAQLRRETVTDYLTGLHNRRYFTERNQAAYSRFKRYGERYALLLFDIDHFKSVNDRYGHDMGDQVLRAVASVLMRETRADIEEPARIGGEEFGVLCHGDITRSSSTALAERLRAGIASVVTNVASTPTPLRVTVSVGGALCDYQDGDWENVYRRADAALYTAKEQGRNRVEIC